MRRALSPVLMVIALAAFAAVKTVRTELVTNLLAGGNWYTESNASALAEANPPAPVPQITRPGQLIVPSFHQVLWRPDSDLRDVSVDSIEAQLLLTQDGVADLLLGCEDSSCYKFRISRLSAVESGLFRLRDMKTVERVPIDRDIVLRHVVEYEVRLERGDGRVRAFLDDVEVASLPADWRSRDGSINPPFKGTAGFGAPLGAPVAFTVRKASIRWHGGDAKALHTFTDEFTHDRRPITIILAVLMVAAETLAAWLGLAILIWSSLRIRFSAAVRKAAIPFGPIMAIHLVLASSHPTETVGLSVFTLIVSYLVILVRHRERIRWHVPPAAAGEPSVSAAAVRNLFSTSRLFRWSLFGLLGMAAAAPAVLAAGGWFPPYPQPLLQSLPASHALRVGEPLPMGESVADFTMQADISLAKESTAELAFRLRTRNQICDWYALRLTTGTPDDRGIVLTTRGDASCGFVKSFGPEREPPFPDLPQPGRGKLLEPGRTYSIRVEVRGSHAVASLDGNPWDEFDVSRIDSGAVGFVARLGTSSIGNISISAPSGSSLLRHTWVQALLIGLILAALPMAATAVAALLSGITRIPFAHMLRFQMLLAVIFPIPTFMFVAIDFLGASYLSWVFHDQAMLVLWLVGNVLYLVANRERARFYSLLMLALLPAIAVAAEAASHQTPLDYYWKGDWQGGYVRDQFIMNPLQTSMVLPSYLRQPLVKGLENSVDKEKGRMRILCVGGSTTRGYGCNEAEESYPAQLKRILSRQWPQRSFEVINAGQHAYASMDVLLYLDRDLKRLKPDLIVLRAGINDPYLQPSTLTQRQQWELIQGGQMSGGITAAVRKSRLSFGLIRLCARERLTFARNLARNNRLGRLLLAGYNPRDNRAPRATMPQFRQNLTELIKYTQKESIPLLLVEEMGITTFLMNQSEPNGRKWNEPAVIMEELAAGHEGVWYVLTGQVLAENLSDVLFVDEVHTSRRGNELIAESVGEVIGRLIADEARHASGR